MNWQVYVSSLLASSQMVKYRDKQSLTATLKNIYLQMPTTETLSILSAKQETISLIHTGLFSTATMSSMLKYAYRLTL